MSKCYRSELVGAFGCPIDENPTGVMEEAAFREKNLDYRYLTVKVNPGDLQAAMEGMKAFQMKGINLTIPHKVEVLKYLDELSPAAEIIGAVNTVINREGRLYGENTDGKGFIQSLEEEGISPSGKRVTVIGAGGAARAIAVECALAGAVKVTIINREEERGKELVDLLKNKTRAEAQFIPFLSGVDIAQETDILVNATSIGLYPDCDQKPDINYDTITSRMAVADVIFNDPNTQFLAEAKKRGAKVINGLGMLVNQGALNFEMWTGVKAPVDVMKRVLKEEFNLLG
ncbi:shikimate dehydrogenase [Kineothrix sp. MB12-C1]|uniref:shikimate dehydrogenase n=1 Tax=Kineothrix sp. MB12-C1 TaxID=3070215 RepID=UPI0027D2487C|nr:shikimate dehydrogenase [Kineothrix sp. MB12-C1]WMC93338.1 shikimate dehydrogenase [Kineothrix sp. MB12-C1]